MLLNDVLLLLNLRRWTYGPKVSNPGLHKIYKPTRYIQGENFTVTYGSTYPHVVSGKVTTDTVQIGGLTVPGVPIGVASKVDTDLTSGGILGMGIFNSCKFAPLPSPILALSTPQENVAFE